MQKNQRFREIAPFGEIRGIYETEVGLSEIREFGDLLKKLNQGSEDAEFVTVTIEEKKGHLHAEFVGKWTKDHFSYFYLDEDNTREVNTTKRTAEYQMPHSETSRIGNPGARGRFRVTLHWDKAFIQTI